MTIKIGIHGAAGRMGKATAKAIAKNDKFIVAATFVRSNNTHTLTEFCAACDVIIDFSSPEAMMSLLTGTTNSKTNILIGTTGLSARHFNILKQAAKSVGVLYAPNTSLGSNLVIEIAGYIGKILSDYDAEIIDLHHRAKKDSPSGTAFAIGKSIALARGDNFADVAVLNRSAKGCRKDREIGFSSIRSGGIFGEHEVIFANSAEVISLGVRALSRSVFAEGALRAAKWLAKKQPGLYSIADVLKAET